MPNKEQMQEQLEVGMVENPMDESLWEGGPSQRWLDNAKGMHGDVYATEFEDEVFIWRPISRFEYKEILKLERASAMYREERICEKCVLWPEDYSFDTMNKNGAGKPSVLTEQIMEKSGFAPLGEAKKL